MMVLSCFDTRRSASFTAARSARHCHLSCLSRGKQGSLLFILQRLQLAFSREQRLMACRHGVLLGPVRSISSTA